MSMVAKERTCPVRASSSEQSPQPVTTRPPSPRTVAGWILRRQLSARSRPPARQAHLTLSLLLQPDLHSEQPASLGEARADRVQTVAVKALVFVHCHALSPRRQPVRLAGWIMPRGSRGAR
jgi:hypothetical protein